jgi:hypothetical protein
MTPMPRVPFPAAFLLQRWGLDDEVVGDIVEEFRSGRSRLWFWYQLTAAIVLHAARTVGSHRLRTFEGVALGCVVGFLWEYPFGRVFEALSSAVQVSYATGMLMISAGNVVGHLLVGAAIGRVSRPFGPPIVLAYLAVLACIATLSTVYGRVVYEGTYPGAGDAVWMVTQLTISAMAAVTGATVATEAPDSVHSASS